MNVATYVRAFVCSSVSRLGLIYVANSASENEGNIAENIMKLSSLRKLVWSEQGMEVWKKVFQATSQTILSQSHWR